MLFEEKRMKTIPSPKEKISTNETRTKQLTKQEQLTRTKIIFFDNITTNNINKIVLYLDF